MHEYVFLGYLIKRGAYLVRCCLSLQDVFWEMYDMSHNKDAKLMKVTANIPFLLPSALYQRECLYGGKIINLV